MLPSGLAGAQPAPEPPSVTVALASYSYTPTPIVLQAGQPVRLLLQNKAGKGHDFTAPEFFAASRVLSGQAPGGKVNVRPGQTVAIDLIPARGTYPVHCSKFMHTTLGMKSQVVVR